MHVGLDLFAYCKPENNDYKQSYICAIVKVCRLWDIFPAVAYQDNISVCQRWETGQKSLKGESRQY